MEEPFLGWFVGLVVLVQEIFCLGCSSRPSTKNIFFSPYTIAVPLSRVSKYVSLVSTEARKQYREYSLSVYRWAGGGGGLYILRMLL